MKTDYGSTQGDSLEDGDGPTPASMGLVIVWSRDEPHRIGEVTLLPNGIAGVLGRTDDTAPADLLDFQQQRPGSNRGTGPLRSNRISRRQLEIEGRVASLSVGNCGRAPMFINGRPATEGVVAVGDLVEIERRVSLLCVQRPSTLPALAGRPHRFGRADAYGVVGESPVQWALRSQLGFVARRRAHVLILGESGTGKELAAQAIHAQSDRSDGPLVSRNAATIPDGLIDAELFGNARNYPNPGLPPRPGLIGAADGGTLFLDEMGEMPSALQAHLLRLLDDGEYHRLGESAVRRADVRLIAATNRAPEELKHDLAARLPIVVRLPSLGDRRVDVPLLARHLLVSLASEDAEIKERFLSHGEPRFDQELMRQLVTWPYTTHVRELEALLWSAMTTSTGNVLVPLAEPASAVPPEPISPTEITPERIRAALAASGGVKSRAAETLGLRNRFQLLRLLKKHDIE